MNDTLEKRIKALANCDTPELQTRWSETFKSQPPKNASRDFLHRALAHHAQVEALGGLKAKIKRRLAQMTKAMAADPEYSPGPAPSLRAGTKLVREWQGKRFEVMILETGFAFDGRTYDSLSQIATDITGTRWSGPLFFGLKGAGRNTQVRHVA
ncbi:MAG: DUF2924 domain-containing protein [Rhodospirillaceae bacterium]